MSGQRKRIISSFRFSGGLKVMIATFDSPPPGVDPWQWCAANAVMFKTSEAGDAYLYFTQKGTDWACEETGSREITLDEHADLLSKYFGLPREFFYSGKPIIINNTPFMAVKVPVLNKQNPDDYDIGGVFNMDGEGKTMKETSEHNETAFTFGDGVSVSIITRGSPPPGVDPWQWCAANAVMFRITESGIVCSYVTQKGIEWASEEKGARERTLDDLANLLSIESGRPREFFYSGKPIIINNTPFLAVKVSFDETVPHNSDNEDFFDKDGKVKP